MSLDILNRLNYDSYKSGLGGSLTGQHVHKLGCACGVAKTCCVAEKDLAVFGDLARHNLVRIWKGFAGGWLAEATPKGKMKFIHIVHLAVESSMLDIDSLVFTAQDAKILNCVAREYVCDSSDGYRALLGSDDDKACIRLLMYGVLELIACPSATSEFNLYGITPKGIAAFGKRKEGVPSKQVCCAFCRAPVAWEHCGGPGAVLAARMKTVKG